MWRRKRKQTGKVVKKKPADSDNGFFEHLERKAVRWRKVIAYWLMFLALAAAAVKGSADILTELAKHIAAQWRSIWP